jgi:hypothetical protein
VSIALEVMMSKSSSACFDSSSAACFSNAISRSASSSIPTVFFRFIEEGMVADRRQESLKNLIVRTMTALLTGIDRVDETQ